MEKKGRKKCAFSAKNWPYLEKGDRAKVAIK